MHVESYSIIHPILESLIRAYIVGLVYSRSPAIDAISSKPRNPKLASNQILN